MSFTIQLQNKTSDDLDHKGYDNSDDAWNKPDQLLDKKSFQNSYLHENPSSSKNWPIFSDRNSKKELNTLKKDFEKFCNLINTIVDFKRVNEQQGDLFELSNEYSLAHCVAEDMNMGSGIAVTFR